ncbi:2-keto-4-pentenoate hydratase [Rhizobium sp. BK313]|uniref:2-keto-4-pentenoate hydratase n=1 Tax=Rhizobium sp. BK313 TaxID=2587081 RepID=UPI00105BDA8F|nr:fumarylacetoacetate hydrolase family protein [Rhizobium sp. BK313]MBB3455994.1 2-keto-4-pentenoate hydratase [Rhizobium sp. BK313]
MEQADLETAIRLLSDAAKSGEWLRELPAASKPPSISEALQMQESLVARLDGTVSGWKVATDASSGASMWGAIFAADCLDSPARIDGRMYAPLGVEGEIAFRFDHDLPSRTEPYSRSEIEAVVTAFPAIEIVSSRFISYQDTPVLDRLVDRMSNGGLVIGTPRPDWRDIDLSTLRVTLSCDGVTILDKIGGHARVDPLLPALDFIHAVQARKTFKAGDVITTGTFTGLVFGKAGQHFTVEFHDFGRIDLTFNETAEHR